MKNYQSPFLKSVRLNAIAILTVSADEEWDDDWDAALDEEEQQQDDA